MSPFDERPEPPPIDDAPPITEEEPRSVPVPRPRLADVVHVEEAPGPEADVWNLLDIARTGQGENARQYPKKTPSNTNYILSQDTRWVGRIRTNDFDGGLYLFDETRENPKPLGDRDLTEIVHWLDRVYSLQVTEERVAREAIVVGDYHAWHPVREWLEGLQWDGQPRVSRLLDYYLGADSTKAGGPSPHLLEALSRCWMISAVARVMDPGCKVDTTLILVGDQGARKSSACRALAMGWFADSQLDLHSKDLYESIQGVWIYELAELDAFNRSEWSQIKAILSSPTDRWRRPYGKAVQARPRQVVFVGTTNKEHFLGDPTGSRRFWPVRVGAILLDDLTEAREQLWAEALQLYRDGCEWWLDRATDRELAGVSQEFAIVHPWTEPISDWLLRNIGREVTTGEILTDAVQKEAGKWTRNDEAEVGAILRRLGYSRVRRRVSEGRSWYWTRDP